MLFLITFLTLGIILGLSIRKIAEISKTSEKVLTTLYYPCLFFSGIFLHLDKKLVSVIDKIGWNSFFNVVIGFCVLIAVTWSVIRLSKLIFKRTTKKNIFCNPF